MSRSATWPFAPPMSFLGNWIVDPETGDVRTHRAHGETFLVLGRDRATLMRFVFRRDHPEPPHSIAQVAVYALNSKSANEAIGSIDLALREKYGISFLCPRCVGLRVEDDFDVSMPKLRSVGRGCHEGDGRAC